MIWFTFFQLVLFALNLAFYFALGLDICLFFAGGHAVLFFIPGVAVDSSERELSK